MSRPSTPLQPQEALCPSSNPAMNGTKNHLREWGRGAAEQQVPAKGKPSQWDKMRHCLLTSQSLEHSEEKRQRISTWKMGPYWRGLRTTSKVRQGSTGTQGCGSPWRGHRPGRKECDWRSACWGLSLRQGLWGGLGREWEGEMEFN